MTKRTDALTIGVCALLLALIFGAACGVATVLVPSVAMGLGIACLISLAVMTTIGLKELMDEFI